MIIPNGFSACTGGPAPISLAPDLKPIRARTISDFAEKPNSVPWPPIILLACLAAGIGLHYQIPIWWPTGPISDFLSGFGFLIVVAAVALYFTSFRQFKQHETTIHPNKGATHLITGGPFAISRNPIYLANVLALGGIALLSGVIWLLLSALVCGILTQRLAILREEKHLASKFGKQWRNYKKTVRRWI